MPEDNFSWRMELAVAEALLKLASHRGIKQEAPEINQYEKSLKLAVGRDNSIEFEHALVNLYSRLHNAGAKYSFSERKLLDARGGYSCFAGGISPIIKAEKFIKPESVTADLGAGNGLQGLLLQYLYPHERTMQIEISSEMIRVGKIMQQALGINSERIEWINNDIADVTLKYVDFIYIYRPALPVNDGRKVYEAIARKLSDLNKPLVVFSIADCLAEFLDKSFSVFYSDGHLTCFSKD